MNEGQSVESKATQSVCAQCGSRLDSTIGGDKFCINCLLRASLGDEGVDRAETPHRFDQGQSIAENHGTPIEFGDYELVEEIGRGSQGVVYRARQKSLNRTVALKIVAYGQWASQTHLKRFRREAEAAASLDHSGIVPIYEVGERDGACYFSMRFVEGGQLDAIAREQPMSLRRAAELIAKVARTVHYAHEHGILHRDIKPGNILLDQKGEPHLTDFGLARLAETESTVTRTREVMGTPSYMAPEQAAGETTEVTGAADVYGLGAVLYQLLTGHPPFAGGTTYETVRLVLDTEPRSPRVLNRKIDRELSTICLKCLEKDPKRRYSSALALGEDLDHWLRHEPIQARRTGIFTRGRKWIQRKPAIAGVIFLSLALAVALGWNTWKSEVTSRPLAKGIAVLPFENLSGSPDNAYFADGIQEEILTRLAKIGGLKVISRTSTQRYQGKPQNLGEIAKQLGVVNILEGSVQKAADQVRINVQLINAQTDSHLWADTYDRKLTDVFGVESEIAKAVAESLQAKLTSREEHALAVKPTNNPDAYDVYLRGMAFEARAAPYASLEARSFYERAVQLDPNFAIAWARLSRAEALLYKVGWDLYYKTGTLAARAEAAKRALENAQRLEPNSSETLLALGYYQHWVLEDFGSAKTTFGRVASMLPGSSEGPSGLGRVIRREGHYNQSIPYLEQALALDPRNVELLKGAAATYASLKQFPAALKLYDRLLDIKPNDPDVMAVKASIYQGEGNLQEAARILSGINETSSGSLSASKGAVFGTKLSQLQFERNYGDLIRLLQTKLAEFHYDLEIEKAFVQLALALTQRLAGDMAGARVTAEPALNTFERLYKDQPNDANLLTMLSKTYAVIGQKEAALRLAKRAVMLDPRAKDPVNGPTWEETLAVVQTLVGDNAGAISTLSQLLHTPYDSWMYNPTGVTPALLRLDPIWDPLRSDPAFQKLCEEKK